MKLFTTPLHAISIGDNCEFSFKSRQQALYSTVYVLLHSHNGIFIEWNQARWIIEFILKQISRDFSSIARNSLSSRWDEKRQCYQYKALACVWSLKINSFKFVCRKQHKLNVQLDFLLCKASSSINHKNKCDWLCWIFYVWLKGSDEKTEIISLFSGSIDCVA